MDEDSDGSGDGSDEAEQADVAAEEEDDLFLAQSTFKNILKSFMRKYLLVVNRSR